MLSTLREEHKPSLTGIPTHPGIVQSASVIGDGLGWAWGIWPPRQSPPQLTVDYIQRCGPHFWHRRPKARTDPQRRLASWQISHSGRFCKPVSTLLQGSVNPLVVTQPHPIRGACTYDRGG